MSNIDWSMLITKEMKDREIADEIYKEKASIESKWMTLELLFIADQLLSLEDDDPTALPVTEREWRDYRIKVRAWKSGAEGYPEIENRPQRPTGE